MCSSQGGGRTGQHALAVFQTTSTALERAQAAGAPTLLELLVSRLTTHSSQDDDSYRTAAEKQAALEADPLPLLRNLLFDLEALDASTDAQLWQAAERQMSQAAKEGDASPLPSPDRA